MHFWAAAGEAEDRFIHLTEGVLREETLEPREEIRALGVLKADHQRAVLAGSLASGEPLRLRVSVAPERVTIDLDCGRGPIRAGTSYAARPGERLTGLGARHGEPFDQAGRCVKLGADRRYTGPDCPEEMMQIGGIPQGDYVPVPWLLSDRGYAIWLETTGEGAEFDLGSGAGPGSAKFPKVRISQRTAAGPLRLHVLTDPTPGRAPAPLPGAHGDARPASGMGLRPLEEPGRLPAPAGCGGRLPGLSAPRPPAGRHRDRLALGDALQHVGIRHRAVPGRTRADPPDARRGRAHGGLGHAVGEPGVGRRPARAGRGIGEARPRAGSELRAR